MGCLVGTSVGELVGDVGEAVVVGAVGGGTVGADVGELVVGDDVGDVVIDDKHRLVCQVVGS